MTKASLKGIVDLHIHTAPDIRERRYTDFDLARAAVKAGARAVVIKSHHGTTMNRAFLTNLYAKEVLGATDFEMFGGIVMNRAVGGINPYAVETAIKMGAKIVWLPTLEADNHIAKHNGKGEGVVSVVGGKVVEPLKEVFRIVRDNDVVFETGHISHSDVFVVVEAAREAGVKKILITHAEFRPIGMSFEEQVKLVKDYGVLLERCFAQPVGGGKYISNLEDNLRVIREIGHEHIVVATDGGQVENPPWEDALTQYIQYLLDNGITQEQIDVMTKKNPGGLLGI